MDATHFDDTFAKFQYWNFWRVFGVLINFLPKFWTKKVVPHKLSVWTLFLRRRHASSDWVTALYGIVSCLSVFHACFVRWMWKRSFEAEATDKRLWPQQKYILVKNSIQPRSLHHRTACKKSDKFYKTYSHKMVILCSNCTRTIYTNSTRSGHTMANFVQNMANLFFNKFH